MFFHRHKGDLGRDTRGSQGSYVSVGVMENRRKREGEREQPTPREKKESRRRKEAECERHYLYSCVSSAYDIMLTKGTLQEELDA